MIHKYKKGDAVWFQDFGMPKPIQTTLIEVNRHQKIGSGTHERSFGKTGYFVKARPSRLYDQRYIRPISTAHPKIW